MDAELAAVTTPGGPEDDEAGHRGDSGLASVARGGAANLIGAASSGIANLLLVVLVARVFSRHDAGVFFSATSLFLLLATVADLGTSTGLVYFIARFRALGTPERAMACIRQALTPVAVVALACSTLLAIYAPRLADALLDGGDTARGTLFLRMLAVFLPFGALLNATLAGTQGFATMRPTVLVDKLGRPLLQLAAVAAASLAGGASALLPVSWAGPYLPATVVALVWLLVTARRVAGDEHARAPQRAAVFWRFTGPRALAGIAQMAIQRLDIVLVGAFLGPVDAAVYTAATRFLVVGQMAAQAINQAVQPRLGELLARDDRVSAGALYRTSTAWLIVLTWPLYLLAACFSGFVLSLFGRGYLAGTPVMLVLAGAMLVATSCGMVDIVLNMAGRTTWNLANYLFALVVNVVANVLLIPRVGILGAALAWMLAILANNLLPLTQVAISLRLQPFSRASLTACALAAVCFGAVPVVVRVLYGGGVVALLVAVAVGMAGYAAGLWRARHLLRLDAMPLLGKFVQPRGEAA